MGESRRSRWVFDVVVGGIGGLVLAAIIAVNIVIFSGIEDGYQASPGDVVDENIAVALLAGTVLVAVPVVLVVTLRRNRRNRFTSR